MAKEEVIETKGTGELSEAYYLENFKLVVHFIESTYGDLLLKGDLKFLAAFKALSQNAQRLYIRLALRTKSLFRGDKLAYPEIDLDDAALELSKKKFIEINPELYFEDYCEAFTVKELQGLGRELGLKKLTGSRDRILEKLGPRDESLFELIKSSFDLYVIEKNEYVEKLIFMFFGSFYEDLSHFILENLGVRKYEPIVLDKSSRLFQSKTQISASFKLSQLHIDLWQSVEADDEQIVLKTLGEIQAIRCPKSLKKKLSKSLNLAARYFERKKNSDLALALFEKSILTPARERRARIHEKKGEFKLASKICSEIKKSPKNSDEQNFADSFEQVLRRKMGLEYRKRKSSASLEETVLPLTWNPKGRVEDQVLSYLQNDRQMKGFFSENDYWCALCILLFWQEFWQAGPGVFYHPFEGAPRDFLSGEFYIRQQRGILEKLKYWQGHKRTFQKEVMSLYDSKYGTYCDLINWKKVERENLKLLVNSCPLEVCLKISEQILKEPREYRSGLPDLFLKNSESFLLGEVKSPRDQVQNSQKRWFKFFKENDIPFTIYRLKK